MRWGKLSLGAGGVCGRGQRAGRGTQRQRKGTRCPAHIFFDSGLWRALTMGLPASAKALWEQGHTQRRGDCSVTLSFNTMLNEGRCQGGMHKDGLCYLGPRTGHLELVVLSQLLRRPKQRVSSSGLPGLCAEFRTGLDSSPKVCLK